MDAPQSLTPPTAQKSGLRKPVTVRKGVGSYQGGNSPAQKRSHLPKPSKSGPEKEKEVVTTPAVQETPTESVTVDTEEVVKPTSFAVSLECHSNSNGCSECIGRTTDVMQTIPIS